MYISDGTYFSVMQAESIRERERERERAPALVDDAR
jgi:hypothetical protein